tara:strand:- start:327 stop:1037 length:711 start_codon:yes stop_codon:yes gene_type:complete
MIEKIYRNKVKIFLIGGNSLIGKSVLNGITKKYETEEIEIISFARSKIKEKIPGKVVFVNNYIESIDLINKESSEDKSKKIIIISYGVLVEEKKNKDLSENLIYHLEINTFQQYEILKRLININNLLEVHIVSSILGDFIRPSLYSYSTSKSLLELLIDNLNIYKEKIFIWKPAFVQSQLNIGRKESFLKTSPDKIEKIVSKKFVGGKYYIPSISVIFTFVAKYTSPLIKWIDEKY